MKAPRSPLPPVEADARRSHHESAIDDADRRRFLQGAGALAAAGLGSIAGISAEAQQSNAAGEPNGDNYVQLGQLHNTATEEAEKTPGPFEPADQRIGFAIVGLGHLSLNQILPAFATSKLCKPVALISASREKAMKIAAQYGIKPSAIYDYAGFDRIAQNPEVKVVYIVLPNSMHREFVERSARVGKHVLCEKPMATSAADCERMIAACKTANVRLMIAYRQQYEPNNRALGKMIRSGKLGKLRSFVSSNSQNQGDPTQWRQKLALAGGGCMPDVGIYCLNAARFLSGEEPTEVFAQTWQPKDDPRFTEVEATCTFSLRFPSGLLAVCNTGYAAHKSQFLRVEGTDAWAEMSPAFAYHGLKLKAARLDGEHETESQPSIPDKDQFALEMDHMALCVMKNQQPHTPGEEGLADQRIVEAVYESARTNRPVRVTPPPGPARGPEPQDG